MTALQSCNLFHTPLQVNEVSKARMKKKNQQICFLTSMIRQIKILLKITSVPSENMLVSQAQDVVPYAKKPMSHDDKFCLLVSS